ncbi:RNA methyltransferase [Halosquirtibacter laminarini]|uniref:RNA methyltransferase n=1 Tax=Halosquirtibacter laminarini TaxID=3374600 RepID=A0AC61NDF1_9BACT|nr:RNA methyltransferase [Prolixibacteraceae bacterium]
MRKRKNCELGRLTVEEFKANEKAPIVVVMDNIRSSNNVGSLFRTSDALKVNALYLCGITNTPPSDDIRKTALGAEESVNWKYFDNTLDAISTLKEQGYRICAIEQVEGSVMLPDFLPIKGEKLALVFGNEVKGVAQEVVNHCDLCIEIPQYGTKHSLNISVSAGIVLWDIFQKIS